jgi:hypothetical protein
MTHSTDRRSVLAWIGTGIALPVLASCGSAAQAKTYKVTLSDTEWKRRLSPASYQVLRHENTRQGKARRYVRLLGLRQRSLFEHHQVRQRDRLAEFLSSAPRCCRYQDRLQDRLSAH